MRTPPAFRFWIYCASIAMFISTNLFAQPNGFNDVLVSDNFNQPTAFTWDTNGRMYVAEKSGKVWIIKNGIKQTIPLIDISDEVGDWRAFGLVGFALDPNFVTNGYFYLCYVVDRHHLLYAGTEQYNSEANLYYSATIGRVTRYTARSSDNFNSTDYTSRKVLIGATPQTGMPILHESHGVGSLLFGADGSLLVAMGDGASYDYTDQGSGFDTYFSQAIADGILPLNHNIGAYRAQVLDSYSGKILRIDPNTGLGIPSNPFYQPNAPNSVQSKIWATGFRNPFRFCRKPGTGSSNPAAGNPGILYIGDVGWNTDEELDVCTQGGQNFGWPRYEGMTFQTTYNNAAYIPQNHVLPKVDWRVNTPRGNINGQVTPLGNWNFSGTPFEGNASVGGFWYNNNNFPAEYQNVYFHADFGGQWIKAFGFDFNHNPTFVREFKSNGGAIVYIGTHPTEGGVWYAKFPNEIRKIVYNNGSNNQQPVAKASANILYSPNDTLTVQFYGDQSFDQNGDLLTYFWNFGDGTTSTEKNPVHTFINPSSIPTNFEVTLVVRDPGMEANQDDITVSLRNTPPIIQSTSIDNFNTYPSLFGPMLNLSATVTDAEHPSGQLSYNWQTTFYHNNHGHPDPQFNLPQVATQLLSRICDNVNTYWYVIKLTVTDPLGLSTVKEKYIYPICDGNSQFITFDTIPAKLTTDAPFALNAYSSSGLPINYYVVDGAASLSGNIVTLQGIPSEVTIVATQHGSPEFAGAIPIIRKFKVIKNSDGNNNGGGSNSTDPVDLELNMTVSNSQPPIYTHVDYTMTIVNKGQGTANDIRINIPFPGSGLAFSGVSASRGNFNGGTKNWEISSLQPNETATLTLNLFTLQTTLPAFLCQVQSVLQQDIDSAPNNNFSQIPLEDDEAVVGSSTNPPICTITAATNSIICLDNNTPENSADDVFTFNLNVNGQVTGNFWQTIINGTSVTGNYGQQKFVGPLPISNGTLNLTIRDGNNTNCTTTIQVIPPQTCSIPDTTTISSNCASQASSPWLEWIGRVQCNNIDNASSKTQYSDFKNFNINLVKGVATPIILSSAFSWTTYNEYWRVWIDFNKNGVYENNEIVISNILNAPANGTLLASVTESLTVPIDAQIGTTTMRISMKRDAYPDACETFTNGEVEDYSVTINNSLEGGEFNFNFNLGNELHEILAYPNPTNGELYIDLGDNKISGYVYITNSLSNVIARQTCNENQRIIPFDMNNLPKGIYHVWFQAELQAPKVLKVILY
ncbi:MAG: PQQ-dependent sugar dehydrogenase [Saprospiraceae bacterium]|nr:PQQ-dependent sugar dehydrogenase [Saprospiraceae bacterium]MBP7699258.1 PQQ-dependent sugar dehydrogenase [Saprospiraceae bacterium]